MILQVDQSVKIENTSADTVLALSNDVCYAILIPAVAKRHCLQVLRRRHMRGTTIVLQVFSAALFLLLERHLHQAERVVIDVEYPRHEGAIKGMLLNWIRRTRPDFDAHRILFKRVGKACPAHRRAIQIVRHKELPDRVVTAREVLRLLRE